MDQAIWWVGTTVIGLMIAGLGFFIKRWMTKQEESLREIREDFQKAISARDTRIDKLEHKLNETIEALPYKFTLREDFLRVMGGVEKKLNKLLERTAAFASGKEEE